MGFSAFTMHSVAVIKATRKQHIQGTPRGQRLSTACAEQSKGLEGSLVGCGPSDLLACSSRSSGQRSRLGREMPEHPACGGEIDPARGQPVLPFGCRACCRFGVVGALRSAGRGKARGPWCFASSGGDAHGEGQQNCRCFLYKVLLGSQLPIRHRVPGVLTPNI